MTNKDQKQQQNAKEKRLVTRQEAAKDVDNCGCGHPEGYHFDEVGCQYCDCKEFTKGE